MQDLQKHFLTYFDPSFGSDHAPADSYRGCFAGKMSPALKKLVIGQSMEGRNLRLPVIFQVPPDSFGRAEKRRRDLETKEIKSLRLVHAYATELTPDQIHLLIRSPEIEYVTLDVGLSTTGLVPTGPVVTAAPVALSGALRRTHIGVALMDSAVPAQHRLRAGRVRLTLDFTSKQESDWLGRASETPGHGGAVAAIIAQKALEAKQAGQGDVESVVDIVALKVVNDHGVGLTSDLIRAVDWVIENRHEFSVKVANLSLAHPAVEDHLKDPLCQAVRRMVVAGITTVASASGPLTQEDEWDVGSPGTEPSAITVAAALSPIRRQRQEDEVPEGYREPEGHFKPDLRVGGACSCDSMAAAEVTGTVARMLAVNPDLSPILVKSILLSTACPRNVMGLDDESGRFLNETEALRMAADMSGQRPSTT